MNTGSIVHLVRYIDSPKEAGAARDKAFHDFFIQYPSTLTIRLDKNRFKNLLKALRLLSFRRKTVLLHLTSMGFPILNNGLIGRISAILLVWWLRRIAGRNHAIIEVNDLYTEQARDLQVHVPINFARIEMQMFRIPNIFFAFASEAMRQFAVEKYSLATKNTIAVINGETPAGAPKETFTSQLLPLRKNDKIKFVYSGTLNRGRSIEEMIAAFRKSPNELILLGKDGQWLRDEIVRDQNISFLGEFDSNVARDIVAQCDIGLIPYDDSRQYYNIAYPTKLSSYLVAGIPFLSTNILEAKTLLKSFPGIGVCLPIGQWQEYVSSYDRKTNRVQKNKVISIRQYFTWENILENFSQAIAERFD